MLDKLSSGDFAPYLNQTFLIHLPAGEPLEVALIQVTELSSHSGRVDDPALRRPFSLIWRSPDRGSYLRQGIYTLEHDQMGRLDLFLAPLGPDQQGMCYEAVFN